MRRRRKWLGFGGASNASTVCRSTYTPLNALESVAAEAMGRRQSTALAFAVPLEAAGIRRHRHREQQPFVRRV